MGILSCLSNPLANLHIDVFLQNYHPILALLIIIVCCHCRIALQFCM